MDDENKNIIKDIDEEIYLFVRDINDTFLKNKELFSVDIDGEYIYLEKDMIKFKNNIIKTICEDIRSQSKLSGFQEIIIEDMFGTNYIKRRS